MLNQDYKEMLLALLEEEAYKDKVIIEIESLSIPILSKENMIKNKNSTGRAKDKVDAETLENS